MIPCEEHPIDHIDKEQPTSASKNNMAIQSDSNRRDGEISCNDHAHDTENDPWYIGGENDPDPVSSHRQEVGR